MLHISTTTLLGVCSDGSSSSNGVTCEVCPSGTAGTGGYCTQCPANTVPNAAHTACVVQSSSSACACTGANPSQSGLLCYPNCPASTT
eukprot:17069-Heterococcus_DN1.PRE.1